MKIRYRGRSPIDGCAPSLVVMFRGVHFVVEFGRSPWYPLAEYKSYLGGRLVIWKYRPLAASKGVDNA